MISHVKGRGEVSLKSKERNETFNGRKPQDSNPKRSTSLTLSGLELHFLPSSYSDLVRHLSEIIPNEKARGDLKRQERNLRTISSNIFA